ncbi:hypothetical protein GOP47_0005871 [Adiantum capillus-veneris]|uniref:Uncharacterized protein n=1 Tax=Adiantum capillus-veneris TaxID=13818 RepID=A0A9D4V2D9_ADICA|nr:hypothetical protein GOP47_0005871 [Adiantum capillus-veneris]
MTTLTSTGGAYEPPLTSNNPTSSGGDSSNAQWVRDIASSRSRADFAVAIVFAEQVAGSRGGQTSQNSSQLLVCLQSRSHAAGG